jgi:hypothetical protein
MQGLREAGAVLTKKKRKNLFVLIFFCLPVLGFDCERRMARSVFRRSDCMFPTNRITHVLITY